MWEKEVRWQSSGSIDRILESMYHHRKIDKNLINRVEKQEKSE
ncbi:MAG: hypothetical protein PT947_02810 [Suipraeoptans intestinalis]|nr:hypothetical protein [Suipraeoptans intestinalis]